MKDYINCFAKTRHVKRDVEAIQKIFPDWEKRTWKGKLGREAEFFLQPYNEVNYQSDDRLDMTGFIKGTELWMIITLRSRNRVYGAIGL